MPSALDFMEGFELFTTPTGLAQIYSDVSFPVDANMSTGRTVGSCLYVRDTEMTFTKALEASANLLNIGLALNMASPADDHKIISMKKSGTEELAIYTVNSGGNWKLRVKRGATTILDTALKAQQKWFHVEFDIEFHDTGGSVTIRFDGDDGTDVTFSGNTSDNGGNSCDEIIFSFLAGAASAWVQVDDIFVFRGATGFKGDHVVCSGLPSADGNVNQFSRSSGDDNYALVDEPNEADGDTSYTYVDSDDQIDLFVYSDLAKSGSVAAVEIITIAKLATAGSRDFQAATRIGDTNYFGTSKTVDSTGYAAYRQTFDVKPSDATPWTADDVDAAEFGYKTVSS